MCLQGHQVTAPSGRLRPRVARDLPTSTNRPRTFVASSLQSLFCFPDVAVFAYVADKAPPEATFRGAEYLSYDLSRTGGEPIVSTQDTVSLSFKTRSPGGLLFYTGKLARVGLDWPIERAVRMATNGVAAC